MRIKKFNEAYQTDNNIKSFIDDCEKELEHDSISVTNYRKLLHFFKEIYEIKLLDVECDYDSQFNYCEHSEVEGETYVKWDDIMDIYDKVKNIN